MLEIVPTRQDIAPADFEVAFEFSDGLTGIRTVDAGPLYFMEGNAVRISVKTDHKSGTWIGLYLRYSHSDSEKLPYEFGTMKVL